MGLRGPGAKPVKVSVEESEEAAEATPPWEAPGLDRAERVIAFIETMPITAGAHAGRRFKVRDWQAEMIRRLYRTDDGRRTVRQALITMGRKNGKTQLAAALALAHLVGPEAEPRGQVFSAAADRTKAAIIYNEMKAMALACPALAGRLIVRDFQKHLEDAITGSTYQALSADAKTKHGLSPNFVIYDELAQAPNRKLFDVLATSTAARAEPLMVVISTQSSDPHHVMTELVDYGRQIEGGVFADPTFEAVIYAADPDADPWDEATWHAANPALGDFRSIEEMRASAEQAKRIPAREAAFRNLYLNQPVDAEQRFIAGADWDACAAAVDPEALRGRPCWGGLDLSSTSDLTALVLYFPEDRGAVLPFFWVPGDRLAEREDRDRVPYRTWREAGLIEAPPGRAIDGLAIVRRLAEIASAYKVEGIAFDRWRMADLRKLLNEEGIELPLIDYGQGFKDMAPAVAALEAAILDRRIAHGGHPVLRWNASNAVVVADPAGNQKLDKDRSRERIDGLVALAMALGLHARQPAQQQLDFTRPLVLSA